MKPDNLEMLKALIKVKKLHLSEMEANNHKFTNTELQSTRNSIQHINNTEITILQRIAATEEKNGS